MQTVKILRDDLAKILRENKAAHDEAYVAALEGYWEQAKEVLKNALASCEKQISQHPDVLDRKALQDRLGLVYPQSHGDDFDRVIRMLELSVDDHIELQAFEFDQFVRNKWAWAEDFAASVSNYGGLKARAALVKFQNGGVI
jgi:hypothetical protein